MFGGWLSGRTDLQDLQTFYFERPGVADALARALGRKEHVLLYGAPRQGKSTLVRRTLGDRPSVTFHATDDTLCADVFRAYLLNLGASVVVEQTRRKKVGAKAEVSWGWPIFSAGGSAEASGENEVTRRNFSADLTNPNDICCLLREFKSTPCLVVEHFEQMGRKQRRLLQEFLRIAAEADVLQIILVATSLDFPLDYRERLGLSRCTSFLELPPLSEADCQAFSGACLKHLGCAPRPELPAFLFQVFQGSVEPTLRGCIQAAAKLESPVGGKGLQEALLDGIQEQTQSQFLALMAAIVEADWTFTCAHRVARLETEEAPPADAKVPIDAALAGDPVYQKLQQALAAEAEQPADLPEELVALHTAALALGRQVLVVPTEAERVRLLAYALGELAEDPTAAVGDAYEPAYEEDREAFNAGFTLCDLLLAADLGQELVVTAETLAAHFGAGGRELVAPRSGHPVFPGFARKLRRLQRRLGLTPPVFKVSDDLGRITLWDPGYALLFGDIKPGLKGLVEDLQDEDGSQ